jgi:hypothetical protein
MLDILRDQNLGRGSILLLSSFVSIQILSARVLCKNHRQLPLNIVVHVVYTAVVYYMSNFDNDVGKFFICCAIVILVVINSIAFGKTRVDMHLISVWKLSYIGFKVLC